MLSLWPTLLTAAEGQSRKHQLSHSAPESVRWTSVNLIRTGVWIGKCTPPHTHYVLLGSYMLSRPVSISAPVHQDQIHVEFFISSFAPYERWQLILIPRNIKHTAELSRWKQRAPISPSTVSVPGAPVYLGPKISTHSVRSSNPLSNKKQPALNTVKEFWKGFCCPNNYFMPWTTWNI